MYQRDKVLLGDDEEQGQEPQGDDDFLADRGDEVFGLKLPNHDNDEEGSDGEDYEDYEEDEDEVPVPKGRQPKSKPDVSHKGRYGKDESSDEDNEAASSDDPDAESWGRSYYSRPSTRRGRDLDEGYGVDEEDKEEERMLEEKEAKRLQRKLRSAIQADDDWGLDELDEPTVKHTDATVSSTQLQQPDTDTSLPSDTPVPKLVNHLVYNEPVKLALARDFPLVVAKLQKTERGIKRLEQQDGLQPPMNALNGGLGWFHYRESLSRLAL